MKYASMANIQHVQSTLSLHKERTYPAYVIILESEIVLADSGRFYTCGRHVVYDYRTGQMKQNTKGTEKCRDELSEQSLLILVSIDDEGYAAGTSTNSSE
jgi:hypothetical protein